MASPVPDAGRWPEWITRSYHDQLGGELADPGDLYTLGAVVLCHDRSADPVFVYANVAAQELWERGWDRFIGWPSRLTAPPQQREQRARALQQPGVVLGYSGVRVTGSGRLFRIRGATVWPVADDAGRVVGQAATFVEWEPMAGPAD